MILMIELIKSGKIPYEQLLKILSAPSSIYDSVSLHLPCGTLLMNSLWDVIEAYQYVLHYNPSKIHNDDTKKMDVTPTEQSKDSIPDLYYKTEGHNNYTPLLTWWYNEHHGIQDGDDPKRPSIETIRGYRDPTTSISSGVDIETVKCMVFPQDNVISSSWRHIHNKDVCWEWVQGSASIG